MMGLVFSVGILFLVRRVFRGWEQLVQGYWSQVGS